VPVNRKRSIAVFLAWNALIGFLWIWAREGSVVHMRLIINDNTHTLYCNNRLVHTFDVPEEKGLTAGMPGLGLSKDSRPPLVVKPQEFYNFTVTDLDTGAILVDGASDMREWDWRMIRGSFTITSRNRLRSKTHTIGVTGDPSWSNYTLDVDYANPNEGSIFFRVIDNRNYGRVQLRFWRELVMGISYFQNGKQTYHQIKNLAEPFGQGMKSLVLRFVKVYGAAVLILMCFLLIFILVSVAAQACITLKTKRRT
jgi:hypothetical protein